MDPWMEIAGYVFLIIGFGTLSRYVFIRPGAVVLQSRKFLKMNPYSILASVIDRNRVLFGTISVQIGFLLELFHVLGLLPFFKEINFFQDWMSQAVMIGLLIVLGVIFYFNFRLSRKDEIRIFEELGKKGHHDH